MDLNLSELTIILLSKIHLMAFSDSAISTSNSNLTDMANSDRVLSPVKIMSRRFSNAREKI